jgi:hypothetical protein
MADLSGLLESDSHKALCYCLYSLPAKITPKTSGGKLESCNVLRYESHSGMGFLPPSVSVTLPLVLLNSDWSFRDMNRIVLKLLKKADRCEIWIHTYCTVLAVLVGLTDYTTQLFTIFNCRLYESVLQSFLTVDSDPQLSCVGAVRWCPLASKAGCQLSCLLAWLFFDSSYSLTISDSLCIRWLSATD